MTKAKLIFLFLFSLISYFLHLITMFRLKRITGRLHSSHIWCTIMLRQSAFHFILFLFYKSSLDMRTLIGHILADIRQYYCKYKTIQTVGESISTYCKKVQNAHYTHWNLQYIASQTNIVDRKWQWKEVFMHTLHGDTGYPNQ